MNAPIHKALMAADRRNKVKDLGLPSSSGSGLNKEASAVEGPTEEERKTLMKWVPRATFWTSALGHKLRKELMESGLIVVITMDGISIVSMDKPL